MQALTYNLVDSVVLANAVILKIMHHVCFLRDTEVVIWMILFY